jgi:hypothetical protein
MIEKLFTQIMMPLISVSGIFFIFKHAHSVSLSYGSTCAIVSTASLPLLCRTSSVVPGARLAEKGHSMKWQSYQFGGKVRWVFIDGSVERARIVWHEAHGVWVWILFSRDNLHRELRGQAPTVALAVVALQKEILMPTYPLTLENA